MGEFDAKSGRKRWFAFLNWESAAMADDALAEQSEEFRRGYHEAAVDTPLTSEELADRPERWRASYADAVEKARRIMCGPEPAGLLDITRNADWLQIDE